jgi:uncharacterized protein
MKTELIVNKLIEIEKKYNIEIILAAESGSRAWGFASPDSDYDIRFIYKSKMNHYLSLWNGRDTIEFMTEDDLDGSGWDIKKALILLGKSNSQLIEWIHSPIIYKSNNEIHNELKAISKTCFNPIGNYYHYASTAKNFVANCMGDSFKLKSYFYLLRNVLAAKWIIEKNSFPPVVFEELFILVPDEILEKIEFLINLKTEKKENYLHPKDIFLNEYVNSEMSMNQEKSKSLKANESVAEELDNLFRKIIMI